MIESDTNKAIVAVAIAHAHSDAIARIKDTRRRRALPRVELVCTLQQLQHALPRCLLHTIYRLKADAHIHRRMQRAQRGRFVDRSRRNTLKVGAPPTLCLVHLYTSYILLRRRRPQHEVQRPDML